MNILEFNSVSLEIFCKPPVILNGQAVLPKATYKANERVQYRHAAGFEYGQRGDTVCTKSGWTSAPACIGNVTFLLYLLLYILPVALTQILLTTKQFIFSENGVLMFICCCLVEVMSDSFEIPWTIARQAPLSLGFPRQQYWHGLALPSPQDLPDPGTEPLSPPLDSLPLSHLESMT